MSIQQAGFSRPPIRLNTLDRIKKDPDLRYTYGGKTGPHLYQLLPQENAPTLGGSAIKSLYSKNPDNPKSQKVHTWWVGKMGLPKSLEDSSTSSVGSRSWGSYNRGDMNEEVIKEKIGCDAYRLFGDGLFATPKTRLSVQDVDDPYTKNNDLLKEVRIAMWLYGSLLKFSTSLRVMSKWVTGYLDFKAIQVPHPEDQSQTLSFMEHIELYGRPSEHVIDPQSKKPVPLYGVMAVLAAATSLADIDVLGSTGANCGLIFLSSPEGKVYEALAVKIDPGFAFSYQDAYEKKKFKDPKDILYSTGGHLIHWERLNSDQKDEFLEVKRHILKLNQEEILHYLFDRGGSLWPKDIDRPRNFNEVLKKYKTDLHDHLQLETKLYAPDLEEYEARRESVIEQKQSQAYDQGNYDRALNYQEKMVEIQENEEVVDQKELATSYSSLGIVYFAKSEYDSAIVYCQKALGIYLVSLEENHLDVAACYNDLGNVYQSQAKYDLSIDYLQKALKIFLPSLGENHPDVANCYNTLGDVYQSQDKYDLSIDYLQKALKILLANLGKNHPNVATCYNNLGSVYNAQGKYHLAIGYHRRALNIYLPSLGGNHPDVATCYNTLGRAYKAQNKYGLAIDYYQKAMKIYLASLGENHLDVATCYNTLGNVYYDDLGKYDLAIDYYQKAMKIYLTSLGENHPYVATCYNNLGRVYQAQGKYDLVIDSYQKALKIRLVSLGENHPKTCLVQKLLKAVQGSQQEVIAV